MHHYDSARREHSRGRALRPAVQLLAWLTVTALGGCAIGPNFKRPATDTPTHFKNVSAQTAATQQPPEQWWTLFHDPILDQLIDQVEVSNQNLAAAVAAYTDARTVIEQARASFFPSLSATASAERSSSGRGTSPASNFGSVGITPSSSSSTITTYQAGASASWEIDVWGQLRRQLENARESARAELADLAAARLSAQNQLATAYLELRGDDAEIKLLDASVIAYQRTLDITMNRYKVGTVPKTDVLEAQTTVYSAEQQQAAAQLQRAQLEDAIAALVGKPASDFHIAPRNEWNIPIPDIPTGVPSDLLQRRPDIMAAEHTLAAANANIGIQEAAYFPEITLTGSYGFLSSTLGTLFEAANRTRDAAISASDTVFNFGLTQGKVAQARAEYAQELATYRQTILTAFQDVENDLAAVNWDKKQYDVVKADSQAADENERLTLNEYKQGTVDFTTVVVAQTAALTARVSLAQITISEQTAAVSLMTDLGGGWQSATAPPTAAR